MNNIIKNISSKNIIKSILDILVLQLIKNKPMCRNKILNKINSSFNILLSPTSVYLTLSSLEDQRLVTYNSDKMLTLTKKGETIRPKLIEDYLRLQKQINF